MGASQHAVTAWRIKSSLPGMRLGGRALCAQHPRRRRRPLSAGGRSEQLHAQGIWNMLCRPPTGQVPGCSGSRWLPCFTRSAEGSCFQDISAWAGSVKQFTCRVCSQLLPCSIGFLSSVWRTQEDRLSPGHGCHNRQDRIDAPASGRHCLWKTGSRDAALNADTSASQKV